MIFFEKKLLTSQLECHINHLADGELLKQTNAEQLSVRL